MSTRSRKSAWLLAVLGAAALAASATESAQNEPLQLVSADFMVVDGQLKSNSSAQLSWTV